MPAETENNSMSMGKRKAAILLKMLDIDGVTNVTRYMSQLKVQELAYIATDIKNIPKDELDSVVTEFNEMMPSSSETVSFDSNFATELLKRQVKEDKYFALDFLKRTNLMQEDLTQSYLLREKLLIKQLTDTIISEHPQVAAFIMSYLPIDKAGKIMSKISPERYTDLVYRIYNMKAPNGMALKHLDVILGEKLNCLVTSGTTDVGGIDSLVKIIKGTSGNIQKSIIENLDNEHPELCEQVKQRIIVFEDIVLLDGRSVQKVLKEIDMHTLALAVKKVGDEIRDIIISNLSERAGCTLKEEMDSLGKVPLREVESAQQKIVEIIRQMKERDEITIRREGEIYV
ncbi:MAG: hypothetical protein K8T10_22260 [Candidatus Eremiobacteraeota bacterium]|nr:hypothetical protein [Candidatus Eremiobacteraeota bacterium]